MECESPAGTLRLLWTVSRVIPPPMTVKPCKRSVLHVPARPCLLRCPSAVLPPLLPPRTTAWKRAPQTHMGSVQPHAQGVGLSLARQHPKGDVQLRSAPGCQPAPHSVCHPEPGIRVRDRTSKRAHYDATGCTHRFADVRARVRPADGSWIVVHGPRPHSIAMAPAPRIPPPWRAIPVWSSLAAMADGGTTSRRDIR